MSDQELGTTCARHDRFDDAHVRLALADEYVRRFGGLQPGSLVAGVFATIAVNEAADLTASAPDCGGPGRCRGAGRSDRLGGQGGGGGGACTSGAAASGGLAGRLAEARADRAVAGFRADLRAAIRRALVADRGARAVRETMRVRLAEDIDIVSASAAELEAIATAIGPLVQRLSHILAQLALRRKRKLSLRRTLHRAMGTGGVPFRLVTEPARPPQQEIVVLADMSGSVAAFSRFTLDLLVAMDSRLSRLRVFSFVDGLAEITSLVRDARATGRRWTAQAAQGAVRLTGSSDYGFVMREFASHYAHQLSRRSVVLVVGDARSNYGDPGEAAFAQIRERAGQVYWLNPEPRRYWNDGDSVIGRYEPWCAQVRECRTLAQIADFVQSLAVGAAASRPV
jgi:uncharacterized protein with von Willebrand factor type A (vWA) domain